MPELRTETMTVNMGPQHPSTHGVLNLVLELDGENIVSARPSASICRANTSSYPRSLATAVTTAGSAASATAAAARRSR